MKCPKCIGKLQEKEIKIKKVSEKKKKTDTSLLTIDQCFVCGGVWFDKNELEKYVEERLTIIDSPSLGDETDQEMNIKHGDCPRCRVEMEKEQYSKDKSITVDLCQECGGTWLDSTEIDIIEKLYDAGFLGKFKNVLHRMMRRRD